MCSLPLCAGTVCSGRPVAWPVSPARRRGAAVVPFDQSSLFRSSFVRVERTSIVCCANMGRNRIVDMILKKSIACSNLIEINMQLGATRRDPPHKVAIVV